MWRWVLLFPLAYGIAGGIAGAGWTLANGGQAVLFYVGNGAIFLLPAAVYIVTALLLFDRKPHRTAWLILLACGVALSGPYAVYALQYRVWGSLILAPLSVIVAALTRLVSARRMRAGSPA